MPVLGLKFLKGYVHVIILEGSKASPDFIEYKKCSTLDDGNDGVRMKWFENFFNELLLGKAPVKIGYCITYKPKKDQIPHITFPIALLLKVACERNIPCTQFTGTNFTASKFGLPKGTDMHLRAATLSAEISDSNKAAQDAALASWMLLPN
jgi:hypothetical protein